MAGTQRNSKTICVIPTNFLWPFYRKTATISLRMASIKTKKFTSEDVHKIAKLANIPVSPREEAALADGFNTTMKVVDTLFSVNVAGVDPTSQVTGLENVFREDEIDGSRMFTQDQALSNAQRKHNGYFVVDQILEDD